MPDAVIKTAIISPCRRYRYRLERVWSGEHAMPFVMLNPSSADATIDDPTIRRCMGFARREGAGGIIVVNLYAWRATDPVALRAAPDPYGPDNAEHLTRAAKWSVKAGVPIVCAWGANDAVDDGERECRNLLLEQGARLMCLGKTKAGHPRHPLYVSGAQSLEPIWA